MTARRWGPLVFVALAVGAMVLVRRARDHIAGRQAPGGILVADPGAYDTHSRRLFASFFRAIASDIAATAYPTAKILEVGCGPGHLSIQLARGHST
jgi:2-polyprenyl-3-methyl-5-hydroxy-6-metoxy-1,4-benzoquinol methylase